MNKLLENINSLEQVKQIENNIHDYSPIYLSGLTDGFKPHLVLALFEKFEESIVIIAENEKRAEIYYDSINGIRENQAYLFPSLDINFYNIKSIDNKKLSQRMEVLTKLAKGKNFIVITTLKAMTNKLSTLDRFNKSFVKIKDEDIIDVNNFIENLINLNYTANSLVENKGDFAKRGSIIDFWPVSYDNPIRIELFDDEVDSIRLFDKDSQRTLEKISEAEISPVTELMYSKEDYDKAIKNINREIEALEKNSSDINSQKLIDKYKQITSFIEESMFVSNIDLVNPYRKDNFSNFLDYIPKSSLIFFDDIARILEDYDNFYENFLEDLSLQMENNEVFRSFEQARISIDDIYEQLSSFRLVNLTSILKKSKLFNPRKIIEIKTIESENFNRRVDYFIDRTIELANSGKRILILESNEKTASQLIDAYLDKDYTQVSKVDIGENFEKIPIQIANSTSSSGYYIYDLDFYVFTHKEIYGSQRKARKRKPKNKTSSRDIINYSDLDIGDYVVHENNGIGIYKGLEKIEVNNIEKDFIVIEYRGTDKLFVPVDQMNLISKYIGSRGESPKLSSLGTQTWQKAKARAKKAVDEIADDLVELYAKRSKIKGHAFSKDTTWQNEFENSFPYEETYSQIRSIEEIKKDMESDKPMDRLLCGDVGFGKTEVAIRAAFKAIMDGYQVAFLVPTTILANQHYETIKKRFDKFPVNVQVISRFNPASKNKLIIKELKAGKVDLIIGTHRLLSKDVGYKNLGLLIIDEEQRFGVKHKEKLKELKSSLDVLTLSATPIPRTLQMSLSGIRDLSTLDEAPEERMPVNTYVLEYDYGIIKQAIERELNRNGQVYFVYNRVNDIEKLYNHLVDLVPDANIAIIHGRISPKQIEKTMLEFIDGEIDILLSTTIIETGMDISNVNTIIIYDSDMMGLGQLYQLKGRIGRGNRSSYAYFTYRAGKILSEISEKRLKSIRDFSDFGSGYKIAMKDLELRGAGNLLGESQSGHVEAIGYDLYVKFLQEAVEKASGKEVEIKDKSDVYIDIKVDGYIPNYYIEDQSQKIEIYNRIASIQNQDDYDELVADLIDVYGDIPLMVDNLMYISLIKSLADELLFSEIREKSGNVNIYFENKDAFSFEELAEINQSFERDMSLDLSTNPAFKIPVSSNKLLDTYELLKTIEKVRSKNEK
ncbi:transcription-repair coupling factor [Anaerococcus sp.]|uniref:transcription-repair coupling factor n=1 Tax=Anaerococcus sp. TaxID=1872515 RepID=UPI0027B899D4|nr:transcription-repair coupling factor [Anaerococcus sp.]